MRMNDNVLGSIWCMIGAHAVLSSFLFFLRPWCWVSRAEQNMASWVRSEWVSSRMEGPSSEDSGGAFVGPWTTTWPLPSHTQPESTLPGFSNFTFRFFSSCSSQMSLNVGTHKLSWFFYTVTGDTGKDADWNLESRA